ncbi:MAG TPA: hypothetical protein VGJ17_02500 [Candidatus Limnocylindrales bacterium]
MRDPIARVLNLVAEGRLTADEAAPILDALSSQGAGPAEAQPAEPVPAAGPPAATTPGPSGNSPTFARIQVMEGGRRVVDLRIPTSLGRFALGRVPGLSGEQVGELQRAISSGLVGPLLEVEDSDGDGVRIVLE